MTLQDFESIGITPESITYAISFGFAVVAAFALIGLFAGMAIQVFRKI